MKAILIAGSNSDIGIAVAKALIEHPVKLALHYYFRRKNVKIWPAKSPTADRFIRMKMEK